jgi:predicted amino acid dehydrogenase
MSSSTHNIPIDFALLGHPASYEHLGDIFLHSRPDFNPEKLTKYRATLEKIFEWTPSYASQDPLCISLADGRQLSGRLIFCNFLPEIISSPRKMLAAYQKIRDGCNVAKDLGAKVVGLGGFTSIVGGTQGERESEELGIAITSGNSLTAALALAQVDMLLSRLDWDLSSRTVAVVGASGDIGRACAMALAPRARQLLLVARNRAKLEEIRCALPENAEIQVCTEIQDATYASVIVAATSASQPILSEAALRRGTVVCDVGYPKNLSYSPDPRPEVLTISGGLAKMPFALDITYYTQLPDPTIMYGCFSEAMVLAMSNRYESYSIGQGRITQEKMERILALAREHGFQPAPLFHGKTPVTDETLSTFLQKAAQKAPSL